MKKIVFLLLAAISVAVSISSCSDSETYADQKKRERSAINKYISENNIKVLSEAEFNSNGQVTDTAKHEYVYLNNSGCYLQIIRKGCGEKLKDGETATILCRYQEYNLLTDSLQSSNMIGYYISVVDKMNVTNTSGTFTGTFKAGESLMYTLYGSGSTTVPSGWLVPLSYINIGRQDSEDNEIARIRIIVPHTQGHAYATQGVYPCLYDLTYEKGY
ncbi:MAG TPA: DUF4827 domain-containing protein [Prevotella sp.]|nr:DUF4827 domain-containing protein [Prevotella sp.]